MLQFSFHFPPTRCPQAIVRWQLNRTYIILHFPELSQKIVKTFKLVIPNHRLISAIKNSGISLLIRVASLLPLY